MSVIPFSSTSLGIGQPRMIGSISCELHNLYKGFRIFWVFVDRINYPEGLQESRSPLLFSEVAIVLASKTASSQRSIGRFPDGTRFSPLPWQMISRPNSHEKGELDHQIRPIFQSHLRANPLCLQQAGSGKRWKQNFIRVATPSSTLQFVSEGTCGHTERGQIPAIGN